MRIVLTVDGNHFVELVNEETKLENSNQPSSNTSLIKIDKPLLKPGDMKQTQRSEFSKIGKLRGNRSTMSLFKNTKFSSLLSADSSPTSIGKKRHIDIQQKKVAMTKGMSDKYNKQLSTLKTSFLPTLPANLSRKIDSTQNSFNFGEEDPSQEKPNDSSIMGRANFKMKEILNSSTITRLEDAIQKKKRIKEKLSSVGPNDFRSIYRNKDEITIMREKLDSIAIGQDKLSLIQYLNNKDQISEKLINKIERSNDEQLHKYNKICQIVSNNNEKDHLFKSIINEKIETMKKRQEGEINRLLGNVEKNLSSFRAISQEYVINKQHNRQNKFRELHNDIRKNFWDKFNADHLQRRVSPPLAERNSMSTHTNL